MSSTIHSAPSTSSDVILHPHPLNHVNHNHTESSPTTKSLKRTRSPSLTKDNNDEINDSTITTDTSTKRSRKKRNTTDIDQSLGLVFYLFYWNFNLKSLFFLIDDIYQQINYIFIHGQLMNHMLIYMYYKNKFVIIYLLNHLKENILVCLIK
jgi:hypothetical protein